MFKKIIIVLLSAALMTATAGCNRNTETPTPTPSPSVTPISPTQQPGQQARELIDEPVLEVYVVEEGQIREMAMEEYLQGVLAGEMRNDWPLEALKAQAIIARTYAVKFMEDVGASKYEGADISTDFEEAQAYNAQDVNDLVKQAIEETRGLVITHENAPIYAWFHSHSAGRTALAVEGLEYEGGEQPYIKSVESVESMAAPEDAKEWTATFSAQEIIAAASELGVTVSSVSGMSVGEKGQSGRAVTFDAGGVAIPAASLRLKLGSEKLRSTFIDNINAGADSVTFTGRGYGHGVGMSQWGAYEMAENGMTAEEIIDHYYTDVVIEKFWE